LADKANALVLTALSRAVADPEGVPLLGGRAEGGLFVGTAAGKLAARRCLEEGYLNVVRTETKGRSNRELCGITEKGLQYLLSQVSPRQVLEDFVRVLEARQAQTNTLLNRVEQIRSSLEALRAGAERVLAQIQQAPPSPLHRNGTSQPAAEESIRTSLRHWEASGSADDCPLPELFRRTGQMTPSLTIGQFHDQLRRLHEQQQIYLHPWTGPLYALPEPSYALLVGHEIAYYVSLRTSG
jgi:hypothetical protein